MSGEQSGLEDELSETTEDPAAPTIPMDVLSLDRVFEALAHPRRRYLCYTLLEETAWSLEDLARKVAAWEKGLPEEEVTNWHNDRVYTALYHSHVPKLIDLDVIEFDEATETIEPGEYAAQVLDALAGMGKRLDPADESYTVGDTDE